MIATIETKDAIGHLGDCDINVDAEIPEYRLYKAGTGVCLESPEKQFSVSSAVLILSIATMGCKRIKCKDEALSVDRTIRSYFL